MPSGLGMTAIKCPSPDYFGKGYFAAIDALLGITQRLWIARSRSIVATGVAALILRIACCLIFYLLRCGPFAILTLRRPLLVVCHSLPLRIEIAAAYQLPYFAGILPLFQVKEPAGSACKEIAENEFLVTTLTKW